MKKRNSPVAVAKALHLLAPSFFSLNDKIAKALDAITITKNYAEKYISFYLIIKIIVNDVRNYIDRSDKSLIKLIDEYNYSKYT